jgi:glutaredoxin-related protein
MFRRAHSRTNRRNRTCVREESLTRWYSEPAVAINLAMERPVLSSDRVAAPVKEQVTAFHRAIVDEVAATVTKHPLVVVGMAQNPVVKKARRILAEEGLAYEYLEYGSYLSQWKERLAIKLWAGFPTFPMIFIDGTLIGGASELQKLREQGALKK